MLDVSRDRVPTRETLARLVDLLDLLRINHLELYTEHTFAYRDHETVWRDASPMTAEDVRWLDALCDERGIELAANQNTFGHMARWLRHAAYRHRAEAPDGFQGPAGFTLPASVLAPTEENARFALSLCRELLACHRSRRIHIGCDETFELGQGASREAVARLGRGRVYMDHLLRLVRPLLAEGCQVLFWADMLARWPELLGELPAEGSVPLVWHYEAPAEPGSLPPQLFELGAQFGFTPDAMRGFGSKVAPFADAGIPYWVCPGTCTWLSLVGRLSNARANLLDAARVGRERGAGGLLITDWGDLGHHQPPSVSFPPLVYGAALAWGIDANQELPLARALDEHVFRDEAGELGRALERAGEVYARTGLHYLNASPLANALLRVRGLGPFGAADAAGIDGVLAELEDASAAVERSRPGCADAEIVRRELLQAIRLARHGAWRLQRDHGLPAPGDAALHRDLAEAIQEQRACWLLRSRPGGLPDSLARLEATLASYAP